MSDKPSPKEQDFSAKLFAAARAERPDPALLRRLQMIQSLSGNSASQPSSEDDSSGVQPTSALRWQRARRIAPVPIVLAVASGLWLLLSLTEPPRIAISPEHTQGVAMPPPRTREASAPRASASSKREPQALAVPRPPASSVTAIPRAARRKPVSSTKSPFRSDVKPSPAVRKKKSPAETTVITKKITDLALLQRARAALRSGSAAKALDVLDRYARERSSRALEAEATLLRIETLASLGKKKKASSLASRFVQQSPNSALADRARSFVLSRPAQAK